MILSGKPTVHIIRRLDQLPDTARRGAIAIGNFDGVHRGHVEIVRQLLRRARDVDGTAIVFTFDPHPVRLLRPEQCPPPLTWTERKAELLAQHGVDWIVAYPTDRSLLELPASEFFAQIIVERLDARAMVEGPNFFFGHNREGDVDLLRRLTTEAGIVFDVVEPFLVDGEIVSSSRIRQCLQAGDVAKAAELLSAPYRIRGMVTHGAGRGARLGYPTANLEAIDTLLPLKGVYAGRCWHEGRWIAAAINLGPNPTFGENAMKLEVHLIGEQESLYGQPLEIEFLDRLRDIELFANENALREQLMQDVDRAQKIAKEG